MGMREEFEAWYWGRYGEAYDCTRDEAFECDADGFHENEHARGLFDSWQASRAALMIELPKITEFSASDSVGYVLDRCDDMITAQGWVVK